MEPKSKCCPSKVNKPGIRWSNLYRIFFLAVTLHHFLNLWIEKNVGASNEGGDGGGQDEEFWPWLTWVINPTGEQIKDTPFTNSLADTLESFSAWTFIWMVLAASITYCPQLYRKENQIGLIGTVCAGFVALKYAGFPVIVLYIVQGAEIPRENMPIVPQIISGVTSVLLLIVALLGKEAMAFILCILTSIKLLFWKTLRCLLSYLCDNPEPIDPCIPYDRHQRLGVAGPGFLSGCSGPDGCGNAFFTHGKKSHLYDSD